MGYYNPIDLKVAEDCKWIEASYLYAMVVKGWQQLWRLKHDLDSI